MFFRVSLTSVATRPNARATFPFDVVWAMFELTTHLVFVGERAAGFEAVRDGHVLHRIAAEAVDVVDVRALTRRAVLQVQHEAECAGTDTAAEMQAARGVHRDTRSGRSLHGDDVLRRVDGGDFAIEITTRLDVTRAVPLAPRANVVDHAEAG